MVLPTNGVPVIKTEPEVGNTTGQGLPQRAILPQTMSPEEIALYDRQIRLWGLQAQERLRNAKVILITVRGLGAEIAKNLTLAGIQTLNLVDGGTVQASDLGSSFLLDRTSLGQNRAQASAPFLRDMNPRVTITADPRSLDAIPSLDAIVSIYDLVIATDLGYTALLAVSGSARRCGKPFYAAASVGSFGWAFADLLEHDFTVERTVSNVASTAGRRESPTRIILATKLEQGAGSSNGSSSTAPAKETVTKREVYSPFAAAAFAPLPASEATPRRKLRVSPLLSCVRALWFYQSTRSPLQPYPRILSHNVTAPATNGTTTTADGHPLMQNIHPGNPDCELFLHLAQQHHASLGLPAHTLTTDKVADFLNCCGTELAPVCAVVGGHVAQDAINMLGGKEQPLQNLFVFDADDTVGQVLAMHPAEGPVGTRLELGGQVRGHQRGESGGSRGNGRVVVKMEVKRESEDR